MTQTLDGNYTRIVEDKYEWKNKYETTALMTEVRDGLDAKLADEDALFSRLGEKQGSRGSASIALAENCGN